MNKIENMLDNNKCWKNQVRKGRRDGERDRQADRQRQRGRETERVLDKRAGKVSHEFDYRAGISGK